MPHPVWPLFDLVVRTPRLELRYPDDGLALALARLAAQGVHPPDRMPFSVPWTRKGPGELERSVLQHQWRTRAEHALDDWHLPFAVLLDGEVVGLQEIFSTRFTVRRSLESGSWLGAAFQGRGIGSEMRAGVLELAFGHLGAVEAETSCWEDNPASRAVTRRLGYLESGSAILEREGAPVRMLRFRLPAHAWRAPFPVDVEGLAPCRPLLVGG